MLPMRTGTCSAVKARRKLRLLCIFLTRCMQRIAFNASQAPNLISAFFHKTTFFSSFYSVHAFSQLPLLCNVFALLADVLQRIFGLHYHGADFGELVFAADCVYFAVGFLAEEVKFFARVRIILEFRAHGS